MTSQSWIFSACTAFVVICAVMAAYGFRGRVSTIGVDLGTTFSVVGVSIGGKVKIIEDDHQHLIFPSVVSYLENGEVVVGHDALPRLKSHPESTIFNSKRFIGRLWEDENIQVYGAAHPFKIVSCGPALSDYGTVAFQVSPGRVVSPEDVGTEVLKFLLKVTAAFLGHSQVNKAVIAVPAKFTPQQRAATGAAYKAAGLKVVRVIEEPTAAAVAYKLHKKSNVHHILVYDFGGGTLDVSLLYVAKGSVEVYATDGDDQLGGSDLDMCVNDILVAKLGESGIVLQTTHTLGNDATNACVPSTIRQKAEQIKKDLSHAEVAEFSCNPDPSVPSQVKFNMSRDEFHEGCSHIFARSMLPVTRLLGDLGMSTKDVDEVVLVGGTTRIPLIKQQLREFFQREDLNDKIDPDVTVAHGAASILD